MKRIVIGVDGSPPARRATEIGLELAASTGAQVVFVHFSPLAEALFQEDPQNGPSQQRIEEADPVLHQAAEAARTRGVPTELKLQYEHGTTKIAAELAGFAEGLDADMIVVGNRSRSEVAEVVLGSVSHELLRISPVAVVVVHAVEQKA
jgi:nucleotide-binding universal stress UspA family protein